MKKTLYTLSVCLFFAFNIKADVTLQFSQISKGRATGFANASNVATNGMSWGIVVSTTNSTFSAGSYDVFVPTVSGFLSIGGIATDDYYVASGLTTSTLGATGGDPGGAGGITTLNPVPYGGATGITQNDAFQIIWFDGAPANGSAYGMMSHAQFIIPADGTGTSFADTALASNVFGGATADPTKAAAFTFGGAPVPEPSRLMLVGLGILGLVARRRR